MSAKAIHSMIRVLDEEASLKFYEAAFGLSISGRFEFDDFTLIYLKNSLSDFEVELTVNKGREEPYNLGDGYGHLAFVVEDVEAYHRNCLEKGLQPGKVIEFENNGEAMAKFFFIADPDGYKIEVLQRLGRYQ